MTPQLKKVFFIIVNIRWNKFREELQHDAPAGGLCQVGQHSWYARWEIQAVIDVNVVAIVVFVDVVEKDGFYSALILHI